MKRAFTLVTASALLVFGCTQLSFGCVQLGANNDDGSGGASVCDDSQGCQACFDCAYQNTCRAELGACEQDGACKGLDACLAGAPDVQTEDSCYSDFQAGLPLYNAAFSCVYCDACPINCPGLAVCN